MTQKNLSLFILSVAVLFSVFIIKTSSAESAQIVDDSQIKYPIAELGNCADKDNCKLFCDQSENLESCLAFAEKNQMMSSDELAQAKKFLAAGGKGPGGCASKETCENYCNNTGNIKECVAFAEKTGMMSGPELEEAKKVAAAIDRGVKPPACNGKKECDTYCEDPNHMEECFAFASAAGLMSPEEQAGGQKMIEAIKNGAKPLPCRGKEACDKYCSEDAHFEECVAFGVAAGFMTADEAEMAKKTGGKGPGGCRGKAECDAFCNNPDNLETCFKFGADNGLIPPDQLKQMEEGKTKTMESLRGAPAEALNCLSEALGADRLEKLKTGTAMLDQKVGDSMKTCFDKFGNKEGGPNDSTGPNWDMVPPEIRDCVKSGITPDELQLETGSREAVDRVARKCAEALPRNGGENKGEPGQMENRNSDSGSPSENYGPEGGERPRGPGPGFHCEGDNCPPNGIPPRSGRREFNQEMQPRAEQMGSGAPSSFPPPEIIPLNPKPTAPPAEPTSFISSDDMLGAVISALKFLFPTILIQNN